MLRSGNSKFVPTDDLKDSDKKTDDCFYPACMHASKLGKKNIVKHNVPAYHNS